MKFSVLQFLHGYSWFFAYIFKVFKEGFPTLNGAVEITVMVNDGDGSRAADMACDMKAVPGNVFLDVKWKFVNSPLQRVDKIHATQLPAILPEQDWLSLGQIGSTIECAIRARYTAVSTPGFEMRGTYFMGFVALTKDITIQEGETSYFRFYSTLPILAPPGYERTSLEVNVIIPNVKVDSCDRTEALIEYTQCSVRLPYQRDFGPGIEYNISIVGAVDGAYDNSHDIFLHLRTPKTHHSHLIWQNYELVPVQLHIVDSDINIKQKICKSIDDPHMTTFDGRHYENQLEGEFILYRHTSLPIEVQAYYKKCSETSKATCNCGVAVRAGGDLYIYEKCRNGPLRHRLYTCNENALLVKLAGFYSYVTILATGTVVKVGPGFVEIHPSVKDFGHTLGLCGTFDGNCSNEFIKRDGSPDKSTGADSPLCQHYSRNHYNNFAISWRVTTSESLYSGSISGQTVPIPRTIFCTCDTNKTTSCSTSSFRPFCVKELTPEGDLECLESRRRRAAGMATDNVEEEVVLFDYNSSFVPLPAEWKNGWNETSATAFCESYLMNRDSIATCDSLSVIDAPTSISLCIADIHLRGDITFSAGHLQDLLRTCETEVRKNVSYYSVSGEGDTTSAPFVDVLQNVCHSDCNDRGTCVQGLCVCNVGFTGIDCSLNETHVPTLFPIQFNGLCDLKTRACQASPVYGNMFIKSEKLQCRVTTYTVSLFDVWTRHDTFILLATYSHPERVMCPLLPPQSTNETMTYAYEIAVSNDGETFSEGKNVTVTHSDCMLCTNGISCNLLYGYCVILDRCYAEGETEPGYKCNVCRSTSQPLQWTLENPQACEENESSNGGMKFFEPIGTLKIMLSTALVFLVY